MATNNSDFLTVALDSAKKYGRKAAKAVKSGALKLKKWTAGKLTVVSGKLAPLFSKLKGSSSAKSGKAKASAKKKSTGKTKSAKHNYALRRLPVRRESHEGINSHRTEEPMRYRRGIEAAELFELAEAERAMAHSYDGTAEPAAPVRTGVSGFFYRHRKGLIAACLVFALLFGGARYLLNLYTKEDIFVSDEIQAGNITISDRLTTTDEQAEKVTYFLLLGVDDSSLLTDCIWIMCWDHVANSVNVMQVPRDTYVGSPDSPYPHKINAVYGNPRTVKWCDTCGLSPDESERSKGEHTVCGTELVSRKESHVSALIRVINNRLGLPIDHFVIFNFHGFAKIIDTMGGVDIHLEYTVKDSAIYLPPGDHHLTGWPAVDFMRSRKGFANGDIGRVSNQRILIDALMQKALDMDLASMLDVVITCANAECFQTDLSLAEIKDMAVSARSLSVDKLTMVTMPGYDHWVRPNPSYYVCNETLTAEMINEYLLPYGLPDGSMASTETVNFPEPEDRLKPTGTTGTGEDKPVITTTTTTTGGWEEPTSTTGTTAGSTAPTESTAPTGSTSAPTESTTTTTTTTTAATTTTSPPTTTTTPPAGGGIEITTQPPTTTTAAPVGEPVGGSVTTPLSDPRG